MRVFLCGMCVCLLLMACGRELSVEQQIIATLRSMEVAAENGEHFEFIGYVADPFEGQQGTMDRREFHRFMIFQINQNRRLQAQFFPIYVVETGEGLASAHFNLLVTGGGSLLPENGQVFAVETRWIGDGGDWKLSYADWEPIELPDIPIRGN